MTAGKSFRQVWLGHSDLPVQYKSRTLFLTGGSTSLGAAPVCDGGNCLPLVQALVASTLMPLSMKRLTKLVCRVQIRSEAENMGQGDCPSNQIDLHAAEVQG